jgi:hypothetical protein
MSPATRPPGELPLLDHEVVSFADFLDYRARRLRAPVVEPAADPPDGVTTPTVPQPQCRVAVASVVPPENT